MEDDAYQRQTIEELISISGHEGHVAKNADVALEYLNNNTYDILITDIGMSGMNGWKLAEIVKEK